MIALLLAVALACLFASNQIFLWRRVQLLASLPCQFASKALFRRICWLIRHSAACRSNLISGAVNESTLTQVNQRKGAEITIKWTSSLGLSCPRGMLKPRLLVRYVISYLDEAKSRPLLPADLIGGE
ncbi:hypothetical protein [Caballeronia sp. RCC_10]|uniref:hypothetical protein n=1 Tax=Caballeronia sp. RCC_10 TaxID=3239227 RepID=UPI003524CC1F